MKYLRSVLGFVVVFVVSYLLFIPCEYALKWCYMKGFFTGELTSIGWVNTILFLLMLGVFERISRWTGMLSSFLGYAARGADGRAYVGGIVCGALKIVVSILNFCRVFAIIGFSLYSVVDNLVYAYLGWNIIWLSYCAASSDAVAKRSTVDKYLDPLR